LAASVLDRCVVKNDHEQLVQVLRYAHCLEMPLSAAFAMEPAFSAENVSTMNSTWC